MRRKIFFIVAVGVLAMFAQSKIGCSACQLNHYYQRLPGNAVERAVFSVLLLATGN